MSTPIESGAAALLFAAIFVAGGRFHPLRRFVDDRRSLVSFGAGMSAAYVFVHMMPELQGARRALVAAAEPALMRYEGMAIHFCALVGFIVFYGLEHMRTPPHAGSEAQAAVASRRRLAGFAAYVWLMAYLTVHNLEENAALSALYAFSIAVHFLTIEHALREEYGEDFRRRGCFVLAGMALLGWGVGQLLALPTSLLSLLVAFISGAIIMNSLVMELPSGKGGRFLPFLAGGTLYGLLLLPLG